MTFDCKTTNCMYLVWIFFLKNTDEAILCSLLTILQTLNYLHSSLFTSRTLSLSLMAKNSTGRLSSSLLMQGVLIFYTFLLSTITSFYQQTLSDFGPPVRSCCVGCLENCHKTWYDPSWSHQKMLIAIHVNLHDLRHLLSYFSRCHRLSCKRRDNAVWHWWNPNSMLNTAKRLQWTFAISERHIKDICSTKNCIQKPEKSKLHSFKTAVS